MMRRLSDSSSGACWAWHPSSILSLKNLRLPANPSYIGRREAEHPHITRSGIRYRFRQGDCWHDNHGFVGEAGNAMAAGVSKAEIVWLGWLSP